MTSSRLLVHVSSQTVRNRLHEGGIRAFSGTCAHRPVPCSSVHDMIRLQYRLDL